MSSHGDEEDGIGEIEQSVSPPPSCEPFPVASGFRIVSAAGPAITAPRPGPDSLDDTHVKDATDGRTDIYAAPMNAERRGWRWPWRS